MMKASPIFFAWTRSFWLGVFPAILALLDLLIAASQSDTVGPVAELISLATGWDTQTCETILRAAGSLGAIIVAHQRRGENRPYTTDPRALK